mmetsp:Transcript_17290/g.65487  ORF Transcript_17290/g.65487 Transcript_17290/m.65487 type:complete len:249 (-) Transcript_17290:2255-3001(-)
MPCSADGSAAAAWLVAAALCTELRTARHRRRPRCTLAPPTCAEPRKSDSAVLNPGTSPPARWPRSADWECPNKASSPAAAAKPSAAACRARIEGTPSGELAWATVALSLVRVGDAPLTPSCRAEQAWQSVAWLRDTAARAACARRGPSAASSDAGGRRHKSSSASACMLELVAVAHRCGNPPADDAGSLSLHIEHVTSCGVMVPWARSREASAGLSRSDETCPTSSGRPLPAEPASCDRCTASPSGST